MKRNALFLALFFCMAATLHAQEKKPAIQAFGGTPDERASTRIGYWDPAKKAVVGEFAIDYGRPVWKAEYEDAAKFDAMTKGKLWRFGSNFWTVLDTNIPLKVSGVNVPVGAYYLGLHRSEDGATWSLAFLDPAKVRGARLDAFAANQAAIAFKAPIKMEQAGEVAEKLTVTMAASKENPYDVTLKISWGKMQLTAPVQASL
ncbi:MAG TPA: DUF2911 domain-containing protein [Blastocatellia bacterium]|nr:DUF2911 domain-containing protein [Blastocatellia bacterium]